MKTTIECSNCRAQIPCDDSIPEQVLQCPGCRQSFEVSSKPEPKSRKPSRFILSLLGVVVLFGLILFIPRFGAPSKPKVEIAVDNKPTPRPIAIHTNDTASVSGAVHTNAVVFSTNRNIRILGGVPYDFTETIRLRLDFLAALKAEHKSTEETEFFKKWRSSELRFRSDSHHVDGTVLQVLGVGLLVELDRVAELTPDLSEPITIVYVEGFPDQERVVDGEHVFALGMYSGRHQYIAVNGATKTVLKFTCALKPKNPIPEKDIQPLP